MADLKVTRFIIDGKTFAIPSAGTAQAGLMSAEDFKKLSGVANGAQVNVIEGVSVNGTALDIAEKIVDILIASGTANGSIRVNGIDVAVKGLAALAYKSEITVTELSAALKAVIDAKAEKSEVTALSGKIEVLNGLGAGSVSKAITDAFNKFTTDVTDDEVVNSFKELVDWAAEHGSEAGEMAAAISSLEGLLAGIGGGEEPATVMAAIKSASDKKVDKVSGYGLSKNDFTDDLKNKLTGISESATANTYSYDEDTQTLTLTGFNAVQ